MIIAYNHSLKRFYFILFAGLSLFASCSKQGNGPVPPDPAEPETPVPSDGNVRKSSFLVLREGGTLDEFIDKAAEELGEGPGRNFNKWDILGTYVWPNVKVTGSYEEEVKYLKSFYLQRLEWMNRELAKL